MAILAGIDEAGFGPILGPLVVSSSFFSLPGELLKADLWQKLKKSTAQNRRHLAGRLLIADSKKAYSKSQGIKHLERTAISALKCLGQEPGTLNELLGVLCPDCLGRLEAYPWYQRLEKCKIRVSEADISIASDVFAADLASNGIELLGLQSRCLDVAHYNKMVNSVKNKATVLFTATSQLIKAVWDKTTDEQVQIIIDRQGGRVHYRKNLQRMFPDMELKILKETASNSSYELRPQTSSMSASERIMRLHFVVGADDKFLPTSLASMISKYLRELLVSNINHYFKSHHAELKPTAGYWKDGLRFIDDLKTHIPDVSYDPDQLIRCR